MSLNETRLKEELAEYKKDFPVRWKGEKYNLWEAAKIFKEANWNLDATDAEFHTKLADSLSGLDRLPQFWRSRDVIVDLAEKFRADVCTMFQKLFADSPDFPERIEAFKKKAKELYSKDKEIQKNSPDHQKNSPDHQQDSPDHQQGESVISIYLWLNDPEKYYIYKHEAVKVLADKLGYAYKFPKGTSTDIQKENLRNFLKLYDEISSFIKADDEFMPLLAAHLKYDVRLDPEYKTLTSDFGLYMLKKYAPKRTKGPQSPLPASVNYWWLNSNPKIWKISTLKVGETQSYTLYNDEGHKRRIFQNFVDAKVGDKVIGYESTPTKQIVSLCEVSAKQENKEIEFRKLENLDCPIDLAKIQSVQELEGMEYFINPNGSFFKLSKDEYDCLTDIIREDNPQPTPPQEKKYTKENFKEDVFMDGDRFEQLLGLLKSKKNIILKGVPGVGKTWAATRLAYVMMGKEDDSKIESIQFHQNYSYEDFMMGYKPAEDTAGGSSGVSFTLKNGSFYRFCLKARNHPEDEYFFIIDEINRGNMSKIFGELLMLIEKEYRGDKKKITLPYKDESFSVPENIYIIGMMNTADRSLAMIDYALRRRFGHFELEPAFKTESFKAYKNSLHNDTFNKLIDAIIALNDYITKDTTLGKGFCIGHSYFCNWNPKDDKETIFRKMRSVVDYEILPLLEEYWFDDPKKIAAQKNLLYAALGVSDDTSGNK